MSKTSCHLLTQAPHPKSQSEPSAPHNCGDLHNAAPGNSIKINPQAEVVPDLNLPRTAHQCHCHPTANDFECPLSAPQDSRRLDDHSGSGTEGGLPNYRLPETAARDPFVEFPQGAKYSPPVPEITLHSTLTLVPDFMIWVLAVIATSVTSFAVYFGWNGSISSTPATVFLWDTPDNPIFAISVLSFLATVFVGHLITMTCDAVRWTKACREQGMYFLSFLAMSSSTSIVGLLHLLFSPTVEFDLRSVRHRWWAFQRLLLYTFQGLLGVILLFNISMDTVFIPIQSTGISTAMQIKGGVLPLNTSYFAWLTKVPDSYLKGMALASFGGSYERTSFPAAELTLAKSPDSWCPHRPNSCVQMYLSQPPPQVADLPEISLHDSYDKSEPTNLVTPFLKTFDTSIYHIYVSKAANAVPLRLLLADHDCLIFGYRPDVLIMCAKEYKNDDGELSLSVTSGACRGNCGDLSAFTSTSTVLIDIWKRRADITYNLRNRSIELFENLSPKFQSQYIDPRAYLYVYKRILPKYPEKLLENPLETTLETMLFRYCQDASILSAPETVIESYLETLMLPWVLQQSALKLLSIKGLSIDNFVQASYCNKSYKVSLAPASFYTFCVLCFLTISWCLAQLFATIFTPRPRLTSFPDMDFSSKLLQKSQIEPLPKLGPGVTSNEIERTFSDTVIRIQGVSREDSWEMENLS